jgi:hypothetical protein
MQTPGALMLAMIGNYFDGIRYGNLDKGALDVKLATAMAAGRNVIIDQQFLSSLADIAWTRKPGPERGGIVSTVPASLLEPPADSFLSYSRKLIRW